VQSKRVGLAGGFAIAVLVAVLLSSVLNTALVPSVGYHVNLSFSNGVVTEQITAWSRYSVQLSRADYLTSDIPSVSTMYFYYDQAYPASYSSDPYWFGLSQLVVQLASERAWNLKLVTLNANQLATFLAQAPASGSVLVMASGVLPDTVYGPGTNEALSWLHAGGTLIWAGDSVGAYAGAPGVNGGPGVLESMGAQGISQFLDYSYLGSGGRDFLNASTYSTAFSFLFSQGLGNALEFNVPRLVAAGGIALGPRSGNFTNLAVIPEGAGRLVDFAGPIWDLNALVQSVMNGIQTGAFLEPFLLLGNPSLSLQSDQQLSTSATYPVPSSNGSSSLSTFCSFAYQPGTFAQFAQVNCLNLA
jgi:hypothetical protein